MRCDIKTQQGLINDLKDTMTRTFLTRRQVSAMIGVDQHTLQRLLGDDAQYIRRKTIFGITKLIEEFKDIDYRFEQEEFEKLCNQTGESYSELEKRIGISAGTIRKICCNKYSNIRYGIAKKINEFIEKSR